MVVLPILAILFAIVATVLAYIFIIPEKKYAKLNKFGKFLHNVVNFKSLIIEKILQALYIFATAFVLLMGFFMLFYVEEGWYSSHWMGGYGILLMLFGPIVVRLAYEFAMMAVLLVKNVIQINNKLKNQNEDEEIASPFAETVVFAEPEAEAAAPAFCGSCGTPVGEGNFCTNCGAKVK